jgi:hypothetical protein
MKESNMKKHKIRQQDIIEEVSFEIDKKAFERPFSCCNDKTKKAQKKISYHGLDFSYEVWKCSKCKKEYLDTKQAKHLEQFWTFQKMLEGNIITIERKMNFDGKTYFFRFPKELTKEWGRQRVADIKLLSPDRFLVEVRGDSI